ncbi:MAG: T9SS type A sorting domain-containing protein [Bacteroidales bacterium]|nr:T9SS type A sorting domain-containing protein [Bacteroidales bacterium]
MAFSRVSSSVDISSLKQGVYVVKITNGKRHCIKRIIKC